MPGCPDFECAKRIENSGQAKVIVISTLLNVNYALRLLDLGASGYLLKKCEENEVAIAIRTVFGGDVYISKKLLRNLTNNYTLKSSTGRGCQSEQLTPKESEVFSLITAGHSAKVIARFFNIELCTVMTHKKRIRRKLNLSNDAELTKFAIRNGLASLN